MLIFVNKSIWTQTFHGSIVANQPKNGSGPRAGGTAATLTPASKAMQNSSWVLIHKKNKLTCYPQQLGRSWKVFVLEPSGTLSAMCTGQLSNFVCYLHQNHPELHGPSAPGPSELDQPSGTLQNLTVRDLIRHLHPNPPASHLSHLRRNPPEPCVLSAPEPSGTLWNFISQLPRNCPEPHQLFARNRLHRNPPELHQPAAPELSGTSSAFCPEPSAPEPSGTSSASCPGTVRNLISHLHRNPLEPHQQSAPEGSGTLRNLLWNLVLQLHRIAPELFWAKDPIASFAVGEKKKTLTQKKRKRCVVSKEKSLANFRFKSFPPLETKVNSKWWGPDQTTPRW